MSSTPLPSAAADGGSIPPEGPLEALLGRLLPAWLARQGTLLAVKDAATGLYVHVNEAMAQWLQCDAAALRAQGDAALDTLWPAPLRAAEQHALQLPPDTPLQSEHRFEWRGALHEFSVWREVRLLPDGRRVLCSLWSDLAPQRRDQQRVRELLQQMEQQQRLLNEQVGRQGGDGSPLDRSTGLHLRDFFEEQLRRALLLSEQENREFALVWVALDAPRAPAQAWDEAAQASVRATLARLLRANTRATDSTCHLDGQRFAVLMANVGLAVAYGRMEQLRRECAAQIVVSGGRELRFTVSMGVASCPHIAAELAALQSACEAALLQAQQRGGDQAALARVPFPVRQR
jgi:diguanylate cyclase (GGDEF)-like protein